MNKLLATSIGVLMLGSGLVAASGTAAQADPYPGTVATTTSVTAPAKVKRKRSATVCATVAVRTGTGAPAGTVTLTVTRNTGKYSKTVSYPYSGGQVCLATGRLKKKGGYTVTATFASSTGTVYNDSTGATGFDVLGLKRR